METVKRNRLKIILILFILFIISLLYQVRAATYAGEHFYSKWINGTSYKCKNWYCVESNQSIEKYIRGGVYGEWDIKKTISIDTTKDNEDLWHVLGAIAYEGQSYGTFDWGHKPSDHANSKYSGDASVVGRQLQGYVWELVANNKTSFESKLGFKPDCSICKDCLKLNEKRYPFSKENAWNEFLNDGKEYKYKIYVWERTKPVGEKAQRLIYIGSIDPTDKILPVTLNFTKTDKSGNNTITGARLSLSEVNNVKNISKTTLDSSNGVFDSVEITPSSGNSGTFKIGVEEITVPNNCLGIPNDVVLTVTYDNGEVTRNKSRK